MKLDDYIDGLKNKDRRILSKAITLVESQKAEHQETARELIDHFWTQEIRSKRVAISGPPGVGKSTFIQEVVKYLSDQDKSVAVLAIDPTSVKSGGSIMGDKTRMHEIMMKENVFVRPSPSGLYLGGVAQKTRESIAICEAFGFDYIIIETVGVGQSEVAAASMVDHFVMLSQPGAGDELQGIKRGILELVDMVVVNKADGDQLKNARLTKVQLVNALSILFTSEDTPEVLLTSALKSEGIEEFYLKLEKLCSKSDIKAKRLSQNKKWMQEHFKDRALELIFSDEKIKKQYEKAFHSESSTPSLVHSLIQEIEKKLRS